MKLLNLLLAALILTLSISCQKDDPTPSKPYPEKERIACRKCDGTWDITDTIP